MTLVEGLLYILVEAIVDRPTNYWVEVGAIPIQEIVYSLKRF